MGVWAVLKKNLRGRICEESSLVSVFVFEARIILILTIAICLVIVIFGVVTNSTPEENGKTRLNVNMSIKQIAPQLGVTGKALARELKPPPDVPKGKPLAELGVTDVKLQQGMSFIRR